MPEVCGGQSSHCRNQSMTTSSAVLAPADWSHVPAKMFEPAARKSPRMLGQVGQLGTNAKKRGWS